MCDFCIVLGYSFILDLSYSDDLSDVLCVWFKCCECVVGGVDIDGFYGCDVIGDGFVCDWVVWE